MPKSDKKLAFSEHFVTNASEAISLRYGNVGGSVDEKPYTLEQAVIDYTTQVLEAAGVKASSLTTLAAYEKIGDAINQSTLLSRTYFCSVPHLLSHC